MIPYHHHQSDMKWPICSHGSDYRCARGPFHGGCQVPPFWAFLLSGVVVGFEASASGLVTSVVINFELCLLPGVGTCYFLRDCANLLGVIISEIGPFVNVHILAKKNFIDILCNFQRYEKQHKVKYMCIYIYNNYNPGWGQKRPKNEVKYRCKYYIYTYVYTQIYIYTLSIITYVSLHTHTYMHTSYYHCMIIEQSNNHSSYAI